MRLLRKLRVCSALAIVVGATLAHAENKPVEVIHWWTSGGEAKALDVLRKNLEQRGFDWRDSSITGGGGDRQRVVLQARIAKGNYADAMQLAGVTVQSFAREDLLGNLDDVAASEGWGKLLPVPLQNFSKYNKHWVAVPLNIHRENWIWANKKIFDELKLAPPASFDDMLVAADRIRKAGYIPLAHGGQPWQTTILFDNAVLSAGGPAFYRKALLERDPKALGSKTMEKAFEQMQMLRVMVDSSFGGRDWNFATSMVINDKAAMQVMGDWAKGEFAKAGKKPGVDYLCFPYPGTAGSFIFLSDYFGLFKVPAQQVAGQRALASVLMEKEFQEAFNLIKGSIPSRTDVSLDNFDACGQQSGADFKQAGKKGTIVGSFSQGAVPVSEKVKAAFTTVVNNFFESDKSPAEATKQLVAAVADASK